MVGLEGDPFGRKDLGFSISAPLVVVIVEVVGTVEVIAGVEISEVIPLVVVIGTSQEVPMIPPNFVHFLGQRSA